MVQELPRGYNMLSDSSYPLVYHWSLQDSVIRSLQDIPTLLTGLWPEGHQTISPFTLCPLAASYPIVCATVAGNLSIHSSRVHSRSTVTTASTKEEYNHGCVFGEHRTPVTASLIHEHP